MPTVAESWIRYSREQTDKAWEHLLIAVRPTLARVVYRVSMQWGVRDYTLIEDALQEAFLKLNQQRTRLSVLPVNSSDQQLEAYLKVIAANAAHDFWKDRQRIDTSSVELCDSLPSSSEDSKVNNVEQSLLSQKFNALLDVNKKERTIFWLYYRQGFTAKEIASIAQFGLGVKGVESLIHRLTTRLKKELQIGAQLQKESKGN